MASTSHRSAGSTGLYRDQQGRQRSAGTFDTKSHAQEAAGDRSPGHYESLVEMADASGTRCGELMGLQAGDIIPNGRVSLAALTIELNDHRCSYFRITSARQRHQQASRNYRLINNPVQLMTNCPCNDK